VQLIVDATDPNTATTVTNYATNIICDYQNDLNVLVGNTLYDCAANQEAVQSSVKRYL